MPAYQSLATEDMRNLLAYLDDLRGKASSDAILSLRAQVTYERLLRALQEPNNWLTYWGDHSAIRHRDLKSTRATCKT